MTRYGKGGYTGPAGGCTGPAVPMDVRYIREDEPGLHVISINGQRPEYLMSRDWMRRNPDRLAIWLVPPE